MKVKITEQLGVHGAGNLTVGSEHDVVPCPKQYQQRYAHCVWVQGETEPVRLHKREYEVTYNSDPTNPAYGISVTEIDIEKMSKDLNEQLQKNPQFKGKEYELREKLALIDGVSLATDNEACFYTNTHQGIEFDFYKKSKEVKNEDGSSSRSISMFPSGGVTLTLVDLLKYKKRETNLAVFMGGRFGYNPRIITNTRNLIEYIEKQKELDKGRVKVEL